MRINFFFDDHGVTHAVHRGNYAVVPRVGDHISVESIQGKSIKAYEGVVVSIYWNYLVSEEDLKQLHNIKEKYSFWGVDRNSYAIGKELDRKPPHYPLESQYINVMFRSMNDRDSDNKVAYQDQELLHKLLLGDL